MNAIILSPRFPLIVAILLIASCTRPATSLETTTFLRTTDTKSAVVLQETSITHTAKPTDKIDQSQKVNTDAALNSTPHSQKKAETQKIEPNSNEYPVVYIPLAGPISMSDSELSGLAWYEENLILLPQYPSRFATGQEGTIFALPKADLLTYLDGEKTEPLTPIEIPFITNGLDKRIKGFEGYEAIVFSGQKVFLTIEAKPNGMLGYLVSGTITPNLSKIHLNTGHMAEIPPQADLANISDEALIIFGNRIISIYEANGLNINPSPVANLFNLGLHPLEQFAFPNIEYRITDVTAPDSSGRFWGINYYYPGDTKLLPAIDPLGEEYGQGTTHSQSATTERLVEFQFGYEGIVFSETPPIQLELDDEDNARNWEGIVRLDDRGFLLATDKFPETILAFLEFHQ